MEMASGYQLKFLMSDKNFLNLSSLTVPYAWEQNSAKVGIEKDDWKLDVFGSSSAM